MLKGDSLWVMVRFLFYFLGFLEFTNLLPVLENLEITE